MEWIVLFLVVGMIYGIYSEWEYIEEKFYGMGFFGKLFCFIVVLSLIGHLFG